MKTLLKATVAGFAIALAGLLIAATPSANQVNARAPVVRQFTNAVTAIAGSAVTNLNRKLTLPQDRNMMTLFKFAMGASSTDVIQFWLYAVPDGTNRLTTSPIVLSVAASGTTAVIAGTNLLTSVWAGNKEVCLYAVSNAHASAVCYLTNTMAIYDP